MVVSTGAFAFVSRVLISISNSRVFPSRDFSKECLYTSDVMLCLRLGGREEGGGRNVYPSHWPPPIPSHLFFLYSTGGGLLGALSVRSCMFS